MLAFIKNNFCSNVLEKLTLSQATIFQPIRCQINNIEVRHKAIAHFVCQVIPAQCPFEHHVSFFGRQIVHIPPLCKLNPVYEEIVSLRFRALCYLADCGEDICHYC